MNSIDCDIMENGLFAIAEQTGRVADNVDKLNDTFDDEFNNRKKRAVAISMVDEDENPVKVSAYFNQPPLFKEDLRNAIYLPTDNGYSWTTKNNIANEIINEPNIKQALKILSNCRSCYGMMPSEIYDELFEDKLTYSPDNIGHGIFAPDREEVTKHNGQNIIYFKFAQDGIEKIKNIYRKQINEAKKFNYDKIEFGWHSYGIPVKIVEQTINSWNPDQWQMKNFKKIDDLVDQNRQELKERLMGKEEKALYEALREFAKPGTTFNVDRCNESIMAVTVNNANNDEAYLTVRLAPNVNATSKEGF